MKNLNQQANALLKMATRNHIDPSNALGALLDYFLETFDMENLKRHDFNYEQVFVEAKEKNADMFQLLADWFMQVTEEIEKGQGYLDWFGGVYEEMFQGRGKASALGQFYTPESLCTVMARCVKPEGGKYNDCACGSGRTLLAAWAETPHDKFQYYEAADIDYISCKMCALNMMIHGMLGMVKRQDSLLLPPPSVIYHVNEVRYPIPCNMYSIRIEYPKT